MKTPIQGLPLCETFFNQIAKPILDISFPSLCYTAGLLGYGSDVLGYDDVVSTDHMWGPRFYLFLSKDDIYQKDAIMQTFAEQLPYTFLGYSVNFSKPNQEDNGVRVREYIQSGRVSPLIFIQTIDEFLLSYLGIQTVASLSEVQWLSISEHRLLGFTAGKLFVDGLHLQSLRDKLSYYPDTVWHYLIAANWSLIAEEQAFTRRCADVSDELGSRLVCSRITERLMRLCFLYQKQYAPYSKWFGTAFTALAIPPSIKDTLQQLIAASDIQTRETALVQAQLQVVALHNACGITKPLTLKAQSYFNRSIQVIFPDVIVSETRKLLLDTPLEKAPLIGSLSQVANFTCLYEQPSYQTNMQGLYQTE